MKFKQVIKPKSSGHSSTPRQRPQRGVLAPLAVVEHAASAWSRRHGSEQKGPHAADLTLLLDEDFKVLVDDGNRKQDAGSRPNGTQEVSQHGEGPDAKPTEGRGRGDVPGEGDGSATGRQQIPPAWPPSPRLQEGPGRHLLTP